ncbi:MAG: hypothetical protein HKM95_12400 [Inquilinus sp.]|nr:hypothetical protein [Inquilinus sp.]
MSRLGTAGRLTAMLLAAALLLAIGGCGRKPNELLPPEDSDGERFPRTYPSS